MIIVVADDEKNVSDLIRMLLEREGHVVACAEDGEQALALIKQTKPQLIISDVSMPKMSGERLLQEIRSLGTDYSIIPFLFLTADHDELRHIDRLNNGADGHITKPFKPNVLIAHVNACLSNSHRHEDFFRKKLHDYTALRSKDNVERSRRDNNDGHIEITGDSADRFLDIIQQTLAGISLNTKLELSEQTDTPGTIAEGVTTQQLLFVRFALDQLQRQRDLVPTMDSEALSWWLVLTVAESQFSGSLLFVSDLYFSAPSAKTTINSRMNLLVERGILTKHNHHTDGRRQILNLNENFKTRFLEHIDTSMDMLREFIFSQPL